MNRKDRRREKAEAKRAQQYAKGAGEAAFKGEKALKARLEAALADARAGRLEDAEGQVRRILADDPDFADAVKALGHLLYEQGRLEDAADMLLAAAMKDDTDAALHATAAACLNLLGRFEEAEAAARFATELDPKLVAAFNNLGVALERQGKAGPADEAFAAALALDPGDVDTLVSLGNRHMRARAYAEAEKLYARARAADPANAVCAVNRAVALRLLGHPDLAEAEARDGVGLDPASPEAHNTLGTVLVQLGDFEAAADAFAKALEVRPDFAGAAVNRGAALYRADRVAEAAEAYRTAARLLPKAAAAQVGLGVCLQALGDIGGALGAFGRARDAEPENAEALFNLAALGGLDGDTGAQDRLAALAADEARDAESRANAAFALVEIADRAGDAKTALERARAANALRRAQAEGEDALFDAGAYDALVGTVIEAFDAKAVARLAEAGSESAMPVFVVGLPRAGTTLVERILAAHPDAVSAGERGVMPAVAEMIGDGDYPGNLDGAASDEVAAAARAYLDSGPRAARVVDKTPFNGLYLGLIAGLFPNAALIRVVRDRDDTALSCYLQNFRARHAWTTDTGDMRRYMAAEDRLFDHWRAVLGARLLETGYEDLVRALAENDDGPVRALAGHCGLAWDAACLDFAAAPGAVKTASSAQVRKPAHTRSIGKARRYGFSLA